MLLTGSLLACRRIFGLSVRCEIKLIDTCRRTVLGISNACMFCYDRFICNIFICVKD